MSNAIPLEQIFEQFRLSLKQKGMTYAVLAKKLHMSESGVKKLFTAKDCSYQRLNEISEILEISLADILSSSLKTETVEVHFSEEQENYFVKNQDVFYFFWKLVQERCSVQEIKKEFRLSERDVFRYLKKLDSFGVIELQSDDKVKLPPMELVKWMGNGPLMKWMKVAWPHRIVQDVVQKESLDSTEHYSLRYYKLTKASQEDLVQRVQEMNREFAERSLREIRLGKKVGLVRMVSAVASGSYVKEILGR